MHSKCVIISHRKEVNCEVGNMQLAKCLRNFNFTNFIMEKSSVPCPHDNCNKSFFMVLNDYEYGRLMETVVLNEQPNVSSHHSLRELIYVNHKIRKNLFQVEKKSVEVQATVDVCSKSTDIAYQTRVAQIQTDNSRIETCETRSVDTQTNEVQAETRETASVHIQTESYQPELIATNVHSSSIAPKMILARSSQSNPIVLRSQTITQEVHEDDDNEVMFIQTIPSTNRDPSKTRKRPRDVPDNCESTVLRCSAFSPNTLPLEVVKEELQENNCLLKKIDSHKPHNPRNMFHSFSLSSDRGTESVNEKEIKREPPMEYTEEVGSLENITESTDDSNVSTGCISIPTDSSFPSVPETKRSRQSTSWFSSSICQRCLILMPTDDTDEVFKHILENHCFMERYHCKLCRKVFKLYETAEEHIKEHVANGKEVVFPCVLCENKEPTASNFSKHDEHSKNFIKDSISPVYLSKLHEICVSSFPDIFTNARRAEYSKIKLGMSVEAMRTSFPQV